MNNDEITTGLLALLTTLEEFGAEDIDYYRRIVSAAIKQLAASYRIKQKLAPSSCDCLEQEEYCRDYPACQA